MKTRIHDQGQGLVEYALILALVAIVVIAILTLLGPAVGNIYSNIVCHVENVHDTSTSCSSWLGGGDSVASAPAFITRANAVSL